MTPAGDTTRGGVAPDGSPVDIYAALPPEPELGAVRSVVAGRQSVLDLGCGTGRIADPLACDGFEVTAVDESAAMLARVQHATAVYSPVAALDLGRRFDVVLMLSHLINSPDVTLLLPVAARHLARDGVVLAQRLAPGTRWSAGSGSVGPVTVGLSDLEIDGDRVRGVSTYGLDGRRWRQPWEQWMRSDEQCAALFADVGLRLVSAEGIWITARHKDDMST